MPGNGARRTKKAAAAAVPPAVAKLQARKRQRKMPLNTYVSPETQHRLEWFRTRGGYTVTDVVEIALNEFLDNAGVPTSDQLEE